MIILKLEVMVVYGININRLVIIINEKETIDKLPVDSTTPCGSVHFARIGNLAA